MIIGAVRVCGCGVGSVFVFCLRYPGNNIHVSFQCIAKPKGFGTCANLPI